MGKTQLPVNSKSGGNTTGNGGSSDGANELMTEQIPDTDGFIQTGRNQVHCV